MPNAWVYIRLDYFCVVTYQKKVVTQLLAKRESFKKRERSNVIPNTTLFDQMLKFGWPQLDFLISFSLAGRSKHTWKEDCICLMGLFFFLREAMRFKGVSKRLISCVLLKPVYESLSSKSTFQKCKTWTLQKRYLELAMCKMPDVCHFLIVTSLACHLSH